MSLPDKGDTIQRSSVLATSVVENSFRHMQLRHVLQEEHFNERRSFRYNEDSPFLLSMCHLTIGAQKSCNDECKCNQ